MDRQKIISSLNLLGHILLLDAHAAGALRAILLVQREALLLLGRRTGRGAVVFLLEDGIRLHGFELGLEVVDSVAVRAAVGAAAGVGEVVAVVFGFFAVAAPARVMLVARLL